MLTIKLYGLLCLRRWLEFQKRVREAWGRGWRFLRNGFWIVVYFLLHSGILLVIVVAVMFVLYQHHESIFEQWFHQERFSSCTAGAIKVNLGFPRYMAPEETAEIQVLVHNQSRQGIEGLRVGILSDKEWWFPDGNTLQIDRLEPLSMYAGKVRMLLPAFVPLQDNSNKIRVFVQEKGAPPTFCGSPLSLDVSGTRKWYVIIQRSSLYVDTLLKVLGVVTAFLTAMLTLSGKWGEFLDKIREWMKQ